MVITNMASAMVSALTYFRVELNIAVSGKMMKSMGKDCLNLPMEMSMVSLILSVLWTVVFDIMFEEGTYTNDKMEGLGKFMTTSGTTLEGQFKNDAMNGQGSF